MHSGFSVLVIGLFLLGFLKAKACVVAKLMACRALEFFCWALEPFKMSWISTLATAIFIFMRQFSVKTLLVLAWWSLIYILVLPLFLLGWRFFILHLPLDNSVCWWHIRLIWVVWRSPTTCFMCLAVALEFSIFLASWHTLLAGNLSSSTLPSFIVLETNSSSFRKKTKDIPI